MSDNQMTLEMLGMARACLRAAERSRLPVDKEDLTTIGLAFEISMKRHIVNARAEIDEAFTDLRGEGKVD